MPNMIYADHAATTFLSPVALNAMMPYMTGVFGNPSSIHTYGEEAAAAVARARSTIAEVLNCLPEEIIFTSGGSEADNHAIAIIASHAKPGDTLLISDAEHHAVLNPAKALAENGITVKALSAEGGKIAADQIHDVARESSGLCGGSIMLVNNETGSIFGVRQIADAVHSHGGFVHTDAVQAVGHIPVDFAALDVDLLSLSAHKFHGPKGVGALICRKGVTVPSFIKGGAQEGGRRAGTENVAGIVGMAAALSESAENLKRDMDYVQNLRDMLLRGLTPLGAEENFGGVPNILSVRFKNGDGEALVRSLDLFGIAASAGAACNSKEVGVSHVLISMGLTPEEAAATVRFSLDASNTEAEISQIISVMTELLG